MLVTKVRVMMLKVMKNLLVLNTVVVVWSGLSSQVSKLLTFE